MDAGVQKIAEQFHHQRSYTRKAARQGVGAEQEHSTCFRFAEGLADSAGVAAHKVQLQLARLSRLDAFGGERSETRRNAIDDFLLSNELLDQRARLPHGNSGAPMEPDTAALENHRAEFLARQTLSGKKDCTWHCLLRGLASDF